MNNSRKLNIPFPSLKRQIPNIITQQTLEKMGLSSSRESNKNSTNNNEILISSINDKNLNNIETQTSESNFNTIQTNNNNTETNQENGNISDENMELSLFRNRRRQSLTRKKSVLTFV